MMPLQELYRGFSWSQEGNDLFRGEAVLLTGSCIYAYVSMIELDGELSWAWTMLLSVWSDNHQGYIGEPILMLTQTESALDTDAYDIQTKLGEILRSLSATSITMLESAVHQFSYRDAFMAIPRSSRSEDLHREMQHL